MTIISTTQLRFLPVSSTCKSAVTLPTLPPPHTTKLPLGSIVVLAEILKSQLSSHSTWASQ